MVLSNKKQKQKLRAAALSESIAASVTELHRNKDESTKPDPSPQSQPPTELLDSATPKPRLSKREKPKKPLSLQESGVVDKSITVSDCEGNKEANLESSNHNNNIEKEKKRKRKRDGDGDGVVVNGVSQPAEDVRAEEKAEKKKNKLLKWKKKWKAKKKKEAKKEEKKKAKEETGKEATKEMKKEENEGVQTGNEGCEEEEVAETNKFIDRQEHVDVGTKIYVGGIPYYSTEDDIRSYFEGCGTITEIDCMYFPETGKFRGIAMISFKTEAAAKRALALDGSDMGGLFLKIQPYKTTTRPNNKSSDFAPKIVEGYNRIYMGNLSWDITEDDVKQLFSGCNISAIRFGMDKETGEFKGYAHVDFSDSDSLKMALKLDQEIVCERPVKISAAVPKKKAETQPTGKKVDNDGAKKKRRTCYQCGEPGHLSSVCPKKNPVDSSAS